MKPVEKLWNALKPRGFLYGRISADLTRIGLSKSYMISSPPFERMRDLGFVRIWHDDWLWGHQVFQKPVGKGVTMR